MAEVISAETSGARPAAKQGGAAPTPIQWTPELETLVDQRAQEQLNRLVKDDKLGFRKQNAELQARFDELDGRHKLTTEELTGLKTYITELAGGEGNGNGHGAPEPADFLDDYERSLIVPTGVKDPELYRTMARTEYRRRAREAEVEKTLTEIRTERDTERAAREKAEKERNEIELSRREATRDVLLVSLASQLDAADADIFRRVYKDDLVWDNRGGRWLFKQKDGELVAPEAGIAAVMPDLLRKSAITVGGSGSNARRVESPENELRAAKEEMDSWHEKASASNGDQRTVAEYLARKRVYINLQKKYPDKRAA